MVAPLNQTIQNTAKCPHGFPVGACPICSGMSGGGARQNRDKPRVAGEMSYNECMAEWMKMLAAKDAKIQAKQDRIENLQQSLLNNRIMQGLDKISNGIQKTFDKILQTAENSPAILKIPIKAIVALVQPIFNFILQIPNAIKNIQTFLQNTGQNILNLINSTTEKLAMIFGEIKNFVNATKEKAHELKKALKSILSLFSEENEKENEEAKEVEKLKARELKEILKGIFRIKRHTKEKNNEEDII